VKFKIDENLPEDLAQLLRDAGWDCRSVVDQQLGGEGDPRIADVCRAENRILITFDRGFANIHSYPLLSHPGVILFRLDNQAKSHVLAVSGRLLDLLRRRELHQELWIVHEDRIRIRMASR
jgi:predicted nuclease of predicted toxin-antitoxin system